MRNAMRKQHVPKWTQSVCLLRNMQAGGASLGFAGVIIYKGDVIHFNYFGHSLSYYGFQGVIMYKGDVLVIHFTGTWSRNCNGFEVFPTIVLVGGVLS